MTKNTQVAKINLQSLIKALVNNAKISLPEARAFRHKEFQKLIAASQGFQSYSAMKRSNVWVNKSEKTSAAVRSEPCENAMIVPGMLVEQYRDGNISMPVTINLKNLEICSVSYIDHDYTDLIGRSVHYKEDGNDKVAYVVVDPEDDQPIYAIKTAQDFEKAMAEKLQFLENGAAWQINGGFSMHGPNGDWFFELEGLLSNPLEISEDGSENLDCLNHLLEESSFWVVDTSDGKEYFISCMDLVQAKFSNNKSVLIIHQNKRDLGIEVLNKTK